MQTDNWIWLIFSQEFNKHDKEPAKYIKHWRGIKPRTGAPYSCDIGYERFLGPEVWSMAAPYIFSIMDTWIPLRGALDFRYLCLLVLYLFLVWFFPCEYLNLSHELMNYLNIYSINSWLPEKWQKNKRGRRTSVGRGMGGLSASNVDWLGFESGMNWSSSLYL